MAIATVTAALKREETALALLRAFSRRTGLDEPFPPLSATNSGNDAVGLSLSQAQRRRYLWTDAFALSTMLGLHRKDSGPKHTDDREWGMRCQRLVGLVHEVLGAHRDDDSKGRRGPLSGDRGRPTASGLRIGKPHAEEFAPDGELIDDWNNDGQYFHYLTKWLHALVRYNLISAGVAGDPAVWAVDLVTAIHPRFTYRPYAASASLRMFWKMSVDLTLPAVPSMGHHDPLDGWISFLETDTVAIQAGTVPPRSLQSVEDAVRDLQSIVTSRTADEWITDDSLGLGGLLCDAWRLGALGFGGNLGEEHQQTVTDMCRVVLEAAIPSLDIASQKLDRHGRADRRLAFREFGLSIGLQAAEKLRYLMKSLTSSEGTQSAALRSEASAVEDLCDRVLRYRGLVDDIHDFWLLESHQLVATWTEHQDINDVMLAASLLPDGFLYSGWLHRSECPYR